MKYTIENEQINAELGYGAIQISPDDTKGYRPFELFVSSLAGCSGTLLRNILTKKRIPYGRLELDVDYVRNPDQANRIEKLMFTAKVYTEESIPAEQAEKLANLVLKNCGMIQSVIQSIEIHFHIQSILSGDN
ncbi:OsmC family protein [Mesobacillus maritimus]|uniref:OsmC family protein n=1 Tax=Mesobacillus maritimus TaxID=1643336 RepID=UPI0020420D4B|nr:OsmC family protein [Mesobacillus maritimus]MCM3667954.1 OsmC family protein [Mesobacillus maritimus]